MREFCAPLRLPRLYGVMKTALAHDSGWPGSRIVKKEDLFVWGKSGVTADHVEQTERTDSLAWIFRHDDCRFWLVVAQNAERNLQDPHDHEWSPSMMSGLRAHDVCVMQDGRRDPPLKISLQYKAGRARG